jgi:hypothetical protein
MKPRSWTALSIAVVLLAACATVSDTSAPTTEVVASGGTVFTLPNAGVAFLPPVGPDIDTLGFYAGASLEIRFLALDGGAVGTYLPTAYSTDDGTVRVEDAAYAARWRVSDTARVTGAPSLVRVEVWGDDLAGTPLDEACFGDGGRAAHPDADPCFLGSFDAMIRPNRSVKSGSGVLDLTRARTLPIRVFIQGGGLRPERLSDLTPLSTSVTFVDVGANCTVNGFNMPGQGVNALGAGVNALGAGVNALGAVGGLFLLSSDAPEPDEPQTVRLLEASEAGALAAALGDSVLVNNAAILIVDDFGWAFRIDDALTTPAAGMELTDLRALVESGDFSHGALVMHQVLEMVEAAGFSAASRPWTGGDDFHVFERVEADATVSIVVAAVDTRGLNTDFIPERIQNALNALRVYGAIEDGIEIRQAAINMSFVIVPCSVLDDFSAAGLEDFEAYVAALAAENDVADDVDLAELLVQPLPNSVGEQPLLDQIQCSEEFEDEFSLDPEGEYYLDWWFLVVYGSEGEGQLELPRWVCGAAGRSTIYVASAGNFGFDYPMYPAAWPQVVGVSSQNATAPVGFDPSKSGFSNSGEVMAPGAVYLLGASDAGGTRVIGYAGTSFSAPVVTLYTALDLMVQAPTCGQPNSSELTGAPDSSNAALADAIEDHCRP